MKSNTKSSITLPPEELKLVEQLKKKLSAKSNVEVVRRGLRLLKGSLDREELRASYKDASELVRKTTATEIAELDHLSAEGLSDDED